MKYKHIKTKSAGFGTGIAQSRHTLEHLWCSLSTSSLHLGRAKHCHPWLARVPRPAAHGLDWAILIPNPNFFSHF